eukprot:UN28016
MTLNTRGDYTRVFYREIGMLFTRVLFGSNRFCLDFYVNFLFELYSTNSLSFIKIQNHISHKIYKKTDSFFERL